MPTTASANEIREAYRRAARRLHPDQAARSGAAAGASTAMADVNEAYRVLRDPARRAVYDASLRGRSSAVPPPVARPVAASVPTRPAFDLAEPARYPWKLVLAMAALGITIVLIGAALVRPAPPARPDNILQTGSCVAIEYTGDAREVNCTGHGDLVVRTIVQFDQACPFGTSAHRDRQGLGNACVEPGPDSGSAG